MSEIEPVTDENIKKAMEEGRIEDVSQMIDIPVEVLRGVKKMTRKERRQWYHKNRKRLGLPRWGALIGLDK